MCTIWMSNKGPIFRPFGPQSQNSGVWSLFQKNFTGFTSVLLLNNTCSLQVLLDMCGIWASEAQIQLFGYFVKKFPLNSHQSCFICTLELLSEMCIIWAQSQSPNLWAILGPKAKVVVFGHFLKNFSMVSHQYCFTCYCKYFYMCREYGTQKPNFWTPKISLNCGLWLFYKIIYPCFRIGLCLHFNFSYFRDVLNIDLRGPISSHFGPQIDHNSGLLQSLTQIFLTDFTAFFFGLLIRGTLKCISMMCPKGPISGPRVKVAVELVRLSGLFSSMNCHMYIVCYPWEGR